MSWYTETGLKKLPLYGSIRRTVFLIVVCLALLSVLATVLVCPLWRRWFPVGEWMGKNSTRTTKRLYLYPCPVNSKTNSMSYDNPKKQSIMEFGNNRPRRHSWRCSSLWRQVALSSGEDLCCVWRSLWQSSVWVSTQQLSHVPLLVQAARCCLLLCINQQHPRHEDRGKGQSGGHKQQCGGRNSPGRTFGAWWENIEASVSILLWWVSNTEPPTAVCVSGWCKNGLFCHRLEISSQKFQAGGCQFDLPLNEDIPLPQVFKPALLIWIIKHCWK